MAIKENLKTKDEKLESTLKDIEKMFQVGDNASKVLVDIKGILNRREYEDAGYHYWRL